MNIIDLIIFWGSVRMIIDVDYALISCRYIVQYAAYLIEESDNWHL